MSSGFRTTLRNTATSLGTNMTSKNVVFKKICKDKSVSEGQDFL